MHNNSVTLAQEATVRNLKGLISTRAAHPVFDNYQHIARSYVGGVDAARVHVVAQFSPWLRSNHHQCAPLGLSVIMEKRTACGNHRSEEYSDMAPARSKRVHALLLRGVRTRCKRSGAPAASKQLRKPSPRSQRRPAAFESSHRSHGRGPSAASPTSQGSAQAAARIEYVEQRRGAAAISQLGASRDTFGSRRQFIAREPPTHCRGCPSRARLSEVAQGCQLRPTDRFAGIRQIDFGARDLSFQPVANEQRH